MVYIFKAHHFSFSDGHDNFFTLKIHHGGFFSKFPGRKYVEGRLAFYDFVDTDLFSVHDLNDMIREIGYFVDDTMYYHYRIPNLDLDFGLKALGNDQDVIFMTQFVPQNRVINMVLQDFTLTSCPQVKLLLSNWMMILLLNLIGLGLRRRGLVLVARN